VRKRIRGDEADPADVAGQAIGILFDEGDGIGAVGLVDPSARDVPTPWP